MNVKAISYDLHLFHFHPTIQSPPMPVDRVESSFRNSVEIFLSQDEANNSEELCSDLQRLFHSKKYIQAVPAKSSPSITGP